jgi:peptidoglycan hydrolase FlgJ
MSAEAFALQARNAYEQKLSNLPKTGKHLSEAQARKTSQEYEGVFLSQMLKPMFENIEAAKPFGGGSGDEIWRSMQVEEFGKAMSRSGGIGLSDAIFRQMMKAQEVQ